MSTPWQKMRFGLAAVFLAAWVSHGTAETIRDDGWELALQQGIPGKGGWTTCYVYARSLQEYFEMAGGESHLVIYDWTDSHHFHNRHAFLVYRGVDGHYWGVDNRSEKPRWLCGATPQEWVRSWERDNDMQQLVVLADFTNKKLAGRTADKTRLASAVRQKKGRETS
ncbi:MAG: hypothetical protein PW734_02140 [Verrucomicrobium sp.]|nr:hypothetical protein [Verrucomicrobium sp.]